MYQTIIVVGNLGRDPEMRYTPSGSAVTNFNIATNRQWTNSEGNQVKETVWFRISAWGKQAESCNQYLQKGSRVLVEGRLIADPDTGGPKLWFREDGSPAASFEVNAQTVRFLSSSNGAGGGVEEGEPETDEEIPF